MGHQGLKDTDVVTWRILHPDEPVADQAGIIRWCPCGLCQSEHDRAHLLDDLTHPVLHAFRCVHRERFRLDLSQIWGRLLVLGRVESLHL